VTKAVTRDPSPQPRPAREHAHSPTGRRPLGRAARIGAWVVGGVALLVVLFVFVFPTRTYLSQRHQLSLAAERLRVLDDQNRQLAGQAARLQTPDEIQRLARAQYHMVLPGEKAYVILPSPVPTTTAPPPAPPHATHHPSVWSRVLTSWLP
jgi:hypothetical protein